MKENSDDNEIGRLSAAAVARVLEISEQATRVFGCERIWRMVRGEADAKQAEATRAWGNLQDAQRELSLMCARHDKLLAEEDEREEEIERRPLIAATGTESLDPLAAADHVDGEMVRRETYDGLMSPCELHDPPKPSAKPRKPRTPRGER